jgi:hypothetical protein
MRANPLPTTINGGFDTLLSRLTPSSAETSSFSSHRQSVSAKLQASLGVSNFFRTGSAGNGTSIRYYSDVDFFASIPSQNQRNDSAYMLRIVKEVLQERFPSTDIHIDTPAVVCEFGSDGAEKIEVVPAYYVEQDEGTGSNIYNIPAVGGGWMRSGPKVHNAYVTGINNSLSSKVKPLIRFMKAIKYYNNIPISSFYLELRIAKWAATERSIVYPFDVRTVLRNLVSTGLPRMIDPAGISGYVAAAHTETYRQDALSKLNTALNRANHAIEEEQAGRTATAYDYWDKVFNGRFPAYG